MNPTVALARQLIQCRSLTPDPSGAHTLVENRLREAGFTLESLPSGPVSNLWAYHGSGKPLLVLAGHSDVVPPGPEDQWTHPPFGGEIEEGWLYGRGAVDMKGALAAQVEAGARFARTHPDHAGTVAFLVTSDEEGPAQQGTLEALRVLSERGLVVTATLVGEPSSRKTVGDAIRIGRRGSLSGTAEFRGESGHVAYVKGPANAAHALVQFLVAGLLQSPLEGDSLFPPLSFHITSLEAPGIARNVVPALARAQFNLRYPPPLKPQDLQAIVERLMPEGPPYATLAWRRSAEPFLSGPGPLREVVRNVLQKHLGSDPELRVDGGTSDGRFFARLGAEVVELGLPSERLHAPDERVAVQDLVALESVYFEVVKSYLETV